MGFSFLPIINNNGNDGAAQNQSTTSATAVGQTTNRRKRSRGGGGSRLTVTTPEQTHSTTTASENSNNCCSTISPDQQCNDASIRHQTRMIIVLRAAVFMLLVTVATIVCVGVYAYTKQGEVNNFRVKFEVAADEIIESFYESVERKLGAIESMSTAITSYALSNNETTAFPFVTMPNFAVLGSSMRVQAEASILHWMPLIKEHQRLKWEEYAMENRHHIDEAFEQDRELRHQQDVDFGYAEEDRLLEENSRLLQKPEQSTNRSETILQDGTGFHAHIWSPGSITARGDEPAETGPYLPLWQRSPISGAKQKLLNMNFANAKVFSDVLPVVLETHEAVMNSAQVPLPHFQETFKKNLAISQYRHNMAEVLEDPHTWLGYPVFSSFDTTKREVVGMLAVSLYWKLFFKNILPNNTMALTCVLENSFSQSIAYQIEGPVVTFLGDWDTRDVSTEQFTKSYNVNSKVDEHARPESRSYTSVRLNQEFGQYTLHVYPTNAHRLSNQPWIYTITVACTFVITSAVYLLYAWAVEQRQQSVMHAAVRNARKAAAAERELNEFLAHEVRNPLAAAIAAASFVDSTVSDGHNITDPDVHQSLVEDVKIIRSSLHFINDFLRSMLDIHRAAASQMELKFAPTDLLKDVLEPASSMLYKRDADVEIIVDCPRNLIVNTDSLRLKQVILNLGRNATKFVQSGFIRLRAAVVNDSVELYVEDSGPGIPEEKRDNLFQKYQASLDLLSQGTGIGLCLCKNLMDMLEGNLYHDQDYHSGIPNQPGARFVIQLRQPVARLSSRLFPSRMSSSKSLGDDSIFSFAMEEGRSSELMPERPRSGKKKETHHVIGREAQDQSVLPEHLIVLFVDDDLLLRKLFTRAVRQVAPTWTIQESSNGETALRLASSTHYDLIFIDQYMASAEKQLLGTETVRALRAQNVTSKLVGLSANDLAQTFFQAGADAFLSKPFPCRPAELRSALCEITASKRPRSVWDAGGADTGHSGMGAVSLSPISENGLIGPGAEEQCSAGEAKDDGDRCRRNDPVAVKEGQVTINTSLAMSMCPVDKSDHITLADDEYNSNAKEKDEKEEYRRDDPEEGKVEINSSLASAESNKRGHVEPKQPAVGSSGNGNTSSCSTGKEASEDAGKEAIEDADSEQLPLHLSIMFVDDDSMLRKLFSRAVKKVAPTWTIHEALSGERALELAESQTYDLIFMDQYMSSTEKHLLGTETVETLRGRGVTSIICGLSANELEQAFVSAGADFFLLKPIPCRPNELQRELHRLTLRRTVKADNGKGTPAVIQDDEIAAFPAT